MLKHEFYLTAMKEGAHLRKAWVIAAFSVVRTTAEPLPWDIRYTPDETLGYTRQPDGSFEWEALEELIQDSTPDGLMEFPTEVPAFVPAFRAMEYLDLKAGDVPNLKQDVKTTYGDVLFNYRVLVYAFDDLLEYQVGPVSIKKIEKWIAANMVSDVEPGEQEDDAKLYVRKYLRYGQAIADLAGFTQLFVPAASARSLQTHPEARQRREELLEKHKDRLHDPAVVAEIQNELVAMDRNWIKGDPSEGFFTSDKQFNTARKRQFLIHGPEAGFSEGGSAELVVNSLDEGWDISKMPAMVNSLRAGSYYRGALTALGGESVKFFLRVFQNTYISEKDCGSTLGAVKLIDANSRDLEGMYHITANGPELLTFESLERLKGQRIRLRSPLYCKTAHSDFCETCMGIHNSNNPLGLGSMAAKVGSTFMSIMMASAHAKELKTAPLRVESFLT